MALWLLDMGANWGKVYPGVRIGTVDVSGMNAAEAAEAIEAEYGDTVNGTQVRVFADEDTLQRVRNGETVEDTQTSEYLSVEDAARNQKLWTTDASELQARLDTENLVTAALRVGREDGGLAGRMAAQTFGFQIEPAVQMNATAVENLAASIDRAIGDPHVDFDIRVDNGEASVVQGHDGMEVPRDWLKEQLERQFLTDLNEHDIVAYAEYGATHVDEAAAKATAAWVNASIGYGATFTFKGTSWTAGSSDLGALIRTRVERNGDEWTLVPYYEESEAKYAILSHLEENYAQQQLSVEFSNTDGSIMVHANAEGVMPEAGRAVSMLEEATLRTQPQETPTIEVAGTQVPTAMSMQAALDYGLITTIAQYETEYTGGATNRNENIHLAADLLNNSIVKANGGEWSFNGIAGECNEEKGFRGAGAIVDGMTVDEVGGGICQVATTVFNAVFEAGYPIDDRTNHSLYIASYPAGRDAAINWPDLDLRWHNDTGSDILMQTSWTDTTVTVTLLGVDPRFTVSSNTGEFVKGAVHGTRTLVDSNLPVGASEVRQTGEDGSSITVTRAVSDVNGQIVRQDEFVSVYDARDEIIAVGPEA